MNRSCYPKFGLKIQCFLLKNTEFPLFTPDLNFNIFLIKGLFGGGGEMNNIFLGVIAVALVAGVIISIYVIVELIRTVRALKELMERMTENSLKPTLIEIRETLESVKNLADNTMVITDDIRTFSGALKDAGKSVKHVSGDVEHVVNLVEGTASLGVMEASSLKAGIKAGLWVLSKSLFKKR